MILLHQDNKYEALPIILKLVGICQHQHRIVMVHKCVAHCTVSAC